MDRLETEIYHQGKQEGAAEAFAACAEILKAEGCRCNELSGSATTLVPIGAEFRSEYGKHVLAYEGHNRACPRALLAQIEARGREGR